MTVCHQQLTTAAQSNRYDTGTDTETLRLRSTSGRDTGSNLEMLLAPGMARAVEDSHKGLSCQESDICAPGQLIEQELFSGEMCDKLFSRKSNWMATDFQWELCQRMPKFKVIAVQQGSGNPPTRDKNCSGNISRQEYNGNKS